MAALVTALPLALAFIAQQFGVGAEAIIQQRFGPLDGRNSGWLTVTGVVMLIGLVYAVAGVSALAGLMAPVLLGPAQAERIAALEAQATRLAEHNRLARELHDSVGHALTVATLQAGAAREMLDTDPEFVRRALTAIEDVGRTAMDDLDHVLGLLRRTDATDRWWRRSVPSPTWTGWSPTLARPAWRCRHIAPATRRECRGGLPGGLPDGPGRADQRRPTRPRPGDVAPGPAPDALELELINALSHPDRVRPGRGGRGLDGLRERVLLLGGRLTVGPDGDRWLLRARLPYEETR
ncbi:histidine kinase dimerization/phosphoacceptor domain-containing protein [Micromonospora sp. M12]